MGTPLLCSKDISRWTAACGGWAPPRGKLAQGGAVGGGWPRPTAWWMGPATCGVEVSADSQAVSLCPSLLCGALGGPVSTQRKPQTLLNSSQHTQSRRQKPAVQGQPSPAQQTREEQSPPPPRPSALGPPESSLPALQPNPCPICLGPPPGTPLTYPLPLSVSPDQRHCQLTHPHPPPDLALTLPTCPRALGTPVPAGPAHQHHTRSRPQTELPRASLVVQGYESTCQCRGHGLGPWSGESPLATGQLNPCALNAQPELQSPWSVAREPTALCLASRPRSSERDKTHATPETQHPKIKRQEKLKTEFLVISSTFPISRSDSACGGAG